MNASSPQTPDPAAGGNFRQSELDKFNQLAQRWWDENGPQKALHALNPARLAYVAARVPLQDARVLDVGCGAGLLSEALARSWNTGPCANQVKALCQCRAMPSSSK